ncbi:MULTISPECIES: pyridoxamine 5'-phosphate oxidase family protein [Micrococcales]|uniref:pyridoxamine 5'-phosphate oxidase family protein n=1 Tax=Micrococcales TaxID=85006 RepID=UPI00068E5E36|nr:MULTISPECIES: pyridoxamine 5'-phosphate oxidase family protein [Micrococcales]
MSELTLETIVEIMRSERFVMMTSVSRDDGRLHSHPMTPQLVTDDAEVWFFIGLDGGQADDIDKNPEINLSFAEVGSWLSVSGHVQFENSNRAMIDRLWTDSTAAWFEGGKEDPQLGLMRFVGESAQLWGNPSGRIASVAEIARTKLTDGAAEGPAGAIEL